MPDISQRPYYCKYFCTYFMPNPYNNYVTDADKCANKGNKMVCLNCAQYLNPPKQKKENNQTDKDVKMSKQTKTPNVRSKYCLYQDVEVVISSFNKRGKCQCLKCKRQECELECRARKSERDRVDAAEFATDACLCNECLNATIYSGQQR